MERFSLELPALLSMTDAAGKPKAFEVKTKDICSGGAFFVTDKVMPIGTDVKMDLIFSLKKVDQFKDKKTHIDVSGAVVRAEKQGVAVCFDKNYNISPFSS